MLKISILLSLLLTLSVAANAQNPRVGTKFPVVNGLATDLQKPDYSQEAKDFCAAGIVSVKVEINEKGNVISAEVITGDELLRETSIQAAKKSKFRVTSFGGTPIKVEGIIVYNFDSLSKCINAGIVNKRALNLPKPKVPNLGRPHLQIKEEQIVAVQIVVDESGKVTTASALTGHPLLRASCVNAARQAKFSPSFINGPPVRVRALLVYKFKPDGSIETDIERADKDVIKTPVVMVKPPAPFCNCRGLGGVVLVQLRIDERGNVAQANAYSGHPFLKNLSEKAALGSRFLPTNTKAKIVISYNFEALDKEGRTAKFKDFEIKSVEIEK